MSVSPNLGSLDGASLVEISSHLDGKSVARLQLVNSNIRSALDADPLWRKAYSRDFPSQFSELFSYKPSIPSWRSEYGNRQRAEHRWESGNLRRPPMIVPGHRGQMFGLALAEDPLPSNLALSGSVLNYETGSKGEYILWEFDKTRRPRGQLLRQRGYSMTNAPIHEDGVFNIAHRPGTFDFVATTFSPVVHVLRLQPAGGGPSHQELREAFARERVRSPAGSPKNASPEDASSPRSHSPRSVKHKWELEHVMQLTGHRAGCAMSRVVNDRAMTASFDGSIRLFALPADDAEGHVPSQRGKHGAGSFGSFTPGPLRIDPLQTYSDDPVHMAPGSTQVPGVCGLTVAPDGTRFASGSNDMQIKLWDAETGKILLRMLGSEGWPWYVDRLDPGLNEVGSANTDGCLRTWDVRQGKQSACYDLSRHSRVTGHEVCPVACFARRVDGRYLVAGSFDSRVYVIDRRMGRDLYSLGGHTDRISRVCMRGEQALSAGFDGSLGVYSFE